MAPVPTLFFSRIQRALPCTRYNNIFTLGLEGPFCVLEKAGPLSGLFSSLIQISVHAYKGVNIIPALTRALFTYEFNNHTFFKSEVQGIIHQLDVGGCDRSLMYLSKKTDELDKQASIKKNHEKIKQSKI